MIAFALGTEMPGKEERRDDHHVLDRVDHGQFIGGDQKHERADHRRTEKPVAAALARPNRQQAHDIRRHDRQHDQRRRHPWRFTPNHGQI